MSVRSILDAETRPVSGETTTFHELSHYSNGNTVDDEGRLVTCEHSRHAISRLEHHGTHHILVDSFEGKKLNSPNDLVVKSDGSIWFTAPPYGILSGREGNADGFRCDVRGNVWTSPHDSIHCFTPEGELIGKILIPEQRAANCTFGDEDCKTHYICGDVSLYSVSLNVAGT